MDGGPISSIFRSDDRSILIYWLLAIFVMAIASSDAFTIIKRDYERRISVAEQHATYVAQTLAELVCPHRVIRVYC